MPRPFGVWAPATTMAEFRSRMPTLSSVTFRSIWSARRSTYYSPEAMAHFKDPQQFKDAVDTCRRMMVSDKFFGEGVKLPHNHVLKLLGCFAVHSLLVYWSLVYYYQSWLPANNPSWRKVVNKEWEEAVNNSPWDHMTHVWGYSDIASTNIGTAVGVGVRKFYIPA